MDCTLGHVISSIIELLNFVLNYESLLFCKDVENNVSVMESFILKINILGGLLCFTCVISLPS